jgi:hypothetical protein
MRSDRGFETCPCRSPKRVRYSTEKDCGCESQGSTAATPGAVLPVEKVYFGSSTATSSASVQVISTLSPTLTFASVFVSSTREL